MNPFYLYYFDRNKQPEKYNTVLKSDSSLFLFVETQFDNWIKNSNPANEYEEKYFGEEAIYSKKGAIEGAIEAVFDEMEENCKLSLDLNTFDYDAIFQG